MDLLINVLLLVAGFVLLIKGADFFVDGASKIADKFGIPQIVIGLTIVAFGTSAPEAAISISSALKGSTGIAIGNVVGSNIMNILLILGITSTITVLKVQKNTVNIEIPFVIFITAVLVGIGAWKGKLGFVSGLILWGLFIVFFVYLLRVSMKGGASNGEANGASNVSSDGTANGAVYESESEKKTDGKKDSMIKLIFLTLIGMGGIVLGSDVTVDSATEIAKIFGMSERLIGLTIVAFGTSLPELITSVTAALKKKADIAIGNIVGSNIFNILFVLGTTCLIKSVPYDRAFIVDGVIAIAAAVLLFLGTIRKKELGRLVGVTMLVCYAGYFVYLLV